MMKKIMKTGALVVMIVLLGFLMLTSFESPQDDIIGTWILEDDTESKWVFTNNTCYWYNNDNVVDTFTYTIQDLSSISNSGISYTLCGHVIKTGGNEDYYLKLIDQDNDEYCYEILGLDNDSLSINFLGQGKIKIFNKE